jgi:hypothetical protein
MHRSELLFDRYIDLGANRTSSLEISALLWNFFIHDNFRLKYTDLNVSLCKIFVLVRTQGLLILVQIESTVLKICAVLHISDV